jgi:hypothetical protein
MARTRGTKYVHVFYDPSDDEDGNPREHDLKCGNECWCEPKAFSVGKTVVVVHDPENGLIVVEDANDGGKNPPQDYPYYRPPGIDGSPSE